jgi:PAS domain S-box-containing protein
VRAARIHPISLLLCVVSAAAVLVYAIAMTQAQMGTERAVLVTGLFALLLVSHLWVTGRAWQELRREHTAGEELQSQFAAAASTSGGWVYVVDPEGRFVYSSDASTEFIGYQPADLLGTHATALLSVEDLAHIESRIDYEPAAVSVVVTKARHRDGADRWFEVTVAPVLGADGKTTIGRTGTARVLTDARHPAIMREIHRREITAILQAEELMVAFQPIIAIDGGHVVGVEALSRFPGRQDGSPDVVFAAAANAGLGLELELLAVRRALFEARLLDPSVYVAVNVSPSVLANPALLDAVQASGIDPARVVLEITEHASVNDYSRLDRPRQRLRELGVRLAVDDAGAGYASLKHIVTLAPDIIKIDRALVTDIDTDRARRALVMAVVLYATEIGTTTVVAEGVETAAELRALTLLGVDAAQGYLISRPTTVSEEWSQWSATQTLHHLATLPPAR